MRKALREYLVKVIPKQLAAGSFGHDLVETKDLAADICFRIGNADNYSFFLHIVCDDENDSFRPHFVWNRGAGYPRSASSLDLRLPLSLALEKLLAGDSGEVHLAGIAGGDLPWVWNLDRSYGDWKSKLDALTADAANGKLNESAYSAHLLAMPNKCSVGEAQVEANKAVEQIVSALGHHGKPIIKRITERA